MRRGLPGDSSAARSAWMACRRAWLAPTPFYLELGPKRPVRSFPANDEDRDKNGLMSGAVFAHAGGDVGISNSWRAGVSYFGTSPSERSFDDPLVSGLKNHISANSRPGARRRLEMGARWRCLGTLREAAGRVFPPQRKRCADLRHRQRAAGHAARRLSQPAVGFLRAGGGSSCRAGVSAIATTGLDSGTMALGLVDSGALTLASFACSLAYNPHRNTLMADWSLSEFSRIRLQFARDASRPDATDNQVWLQYVMSLGAHGAHNF